MSQDGSDIEFLTIVMNCRNQSNFVTSDIENGEFANLIRRWKGFSQFDEIPYRTLFHQLIPLDDRVLGFGVAIDKFIEPFSGDHMHWKDLVLQ